MRVISIDPGVSGAIAVLTAKSQLVEVHDMPTMLANKTGNKSMINVAELARLIRTIFRETSEDVRACMERVTAMPSIPGKADAFGKPGERRDMGAASAFSFGRGVGHIEGVLATIGIPVEYVTPATWKRAFNLPREKEAARAFAQSIYPTAPLGLKKHAGRAEAILIGKWYADRYRLPEDDAPFEPPATSVITAP